MIMIINEARKFQILYTIIEQMFPTTQYDEPLFKSKNSKLYSYMTHANTCT